MPNVNAPLLYIRQIACWSRTAIPIRCTFRILAHADDLVLIAKSTTAQQQYFNVIKELANDLDLRFNAGKSSYIRIPAAAIPKKAPLTSAGDPIRIVNKETP